MADGAGTPYSADEGYFSDQQLERIRNNAAMQVRWQREQQQLQADKQAENSETSVNEDE